MRAANVARMTQLRLTIALLVLSGGNAAAQTGAVAKPAADATILVNRALALLGETQRAVVIYDPHHYDTTRRAKLERFEAFVFAERREIYLNRRGRVLEEALRGSPEGVYLVAALIAHEVAHLEGADERSALQAEGRCVFRFMKEGRISVDVALSHLHGTWRLRR